MENLKLNEEQSPAIDREKLLIESQDREIYRLFSSMENDKVSLSDTENVLLNIGNNNPNARPYILNYVQNNSQNITTLLRENLNYAANGFKGEAIGLYEGTKALITGSVDLLNFMVEYSLNEAYRDEFNNQAEIIYDFLKKEGLSGIGNKVYEAIGNEMDRISKLPPEKQAQAIGEIAGNVISMLAVIKVGTTVVSKLGKVGQAENLITKAERTGNIVRAEKIKKIADTLLASKRGFQAFDILLTGVAESTLIKGLGTSYKSLSLVFANKDLSYLEKIVIIDNEIKKVKELKPESPEEKEILDYYVKKLKTKKIESHNLGKSLLEESKFNFLNKPEYNELRELYGGNIDREMLLGEGQNAIILQHPNKGNRVLKVARGSAKDDIIQEFNNHQIFYETLEQGRVDFPGELSDNIKIPQVRKGGGDNPIYFEMEKIDGQSFKSLFYREKYSKQFEKLYTEDELVKMSDSELETVVEKLGLEPIPTMILAWDGGFSKAQFNEAKVFMWNRIRVPIRKQETELGETLSFLDWKGLKHTDMHCGNFMVSRNGKTTYIIDFGNTNLNIKK